MSVSGNQRKSEPMIHLTDTTGQPYSPYEHTMEPEPASVVLSSGGWGTAWQRYFSDGLWHCVGTRGRGKTWDEMLQMRNLVLVYDARERFDRPRRESRVEWRGATSGRMTTDGSCITEVDRDHP